MVITRIIEFESFFLTKSSQRNIFNKLFVFQSEEYGKKYLVVKLTPHLDLFQKLPPRLIKEFWFFVRVIMQKRTDKVIAVIEWVYYIILYLLFMTLQFGFSLNLNKKTPLYGSLGYNTFIIYYY